MTIVAPTTPRVLVVEDEPDVSELIVEALSREGYDVLSAGSAAEALTAMRQNDVGLLVLDVMLPDMDGSMLHSRLKALYPELAGHTIFISGWARSPEVKEYLESAGTFLPKPFTVEDLLNLTRSLN
jgi:DNA-binding response OmpR family regulator